MASFYSIADQAWGITSMPLERSCRTAFLLPVNMISRMLTIPFIPFLTLADFFRRQSYRQSLVTEMENLSDLTNLPSQQRARLHREIIEHMKLLMIRKKNDLKRFENNNTFLWQRYKNNELIPSALQGSIQLNALVKQAIEKVSAPKSPVTAPPILRSNQRPWADSFWEKSRITSCFGLHVPLIGRLFKIAALMMLPIFTSIDFFSNRSNAVAEFLSEQLSQKEGELTRIQETCKTLQVIVDALGAKNKSDGQEQVTKTLLQEVEQCFHAALKKRTDTLKAHFTPKQIQACRIKTY